MIIFQVLSAAGIIISLGYYAVASLAALRFARRAARPPAAVPEPPPRVAILKPLHGARATLKDNLASYLRLDYPRVEYLFGVGTQSDPATAIVEEVIAGDPRHCAKLVIGEEPDCANRKIAKVIKMAERARDADIVIVSDADIAVEQDHLRRVVEELTRDARIGMVTCAYRARPHGGLGAQFEALSVNTDFAPQVMLAAAIEPMRHGLGATIAIRREALESIGGFGAVKDLLGDDFYLGRFVSEHGWKVRLSKSLVTIAAEEASVTDFWNHQLRWARTYRTVRPVSLGIILTHGPFWALVYLLASRLSPAGFAMLAIVAAARIGMAALTMDRVLGLRELVRDAWMTPIKDLMMTGIWFASLASNKVTWAGRRFEILPDGAMREVKG
jgi:ceramide glucosyltransferase